VIRILRKILRHANEPAHARKKTAKKWKLGKRIEIADDSETRSAMIISVALVSLLFAAYQVRVQRKNLSYDLSRAQSCLRSLQEAIEPLSKKMTGLPTRPCSVSWTDSRNANT